MWLLYMRICLRRLLSLFWCFLTTLVCVVGVKVMNVHLEQTLGLICGPARNQTMTGSLPAMARPSLYQLGHGVAWAPLMPGNMWCVGFCVISGLLASLRDSAWLLYCFSHVTCWSLQSLCRFCFGVISLALLSAKGCKSHSFPAQDMVLWTCCPKVMQTTKDEIIHQCRWNPYETMDATETSQCTMEKRESIQKPRSFACVLFQFSCHARIGEYCDERTWED